MAITFTQNLKLKIDSGLTSDAKYNLERIDTLASLSKVDSQNNSVIKAKRDVYLQPESPDVGGSGVGGDVVAGTASQFLDNFTVYSNKTSFHSGVGLEDENSNYQLRVRYDSTVSGAADTQDRSLTFDVQGADRQIIFENSGTVVFRASTDALTNKTLTDPSNNISATLLTSGTISNDRLANNSIAHSRLVNGTAGNVLIANASGVKTSTGLNGDVASISGTGLVTLADNSINNAKLASSAVLNENVDAAAAIAGTKISPLFGAQEVFSSTGFSSTQGTTFKYPSSDGSAGQVMITNGSGQFSFTTVATGDLTQNYVFIGNASNQRTEVDVSSVGDISASVAGGLEIKADTIDNANVNSAAGIEVSKFEALTASRVIESDVSGFLTASAVTSTELGHVSGVTSSIQTQLDGKQPLSSELTSLGGIATTGILVRTAADTHVSRTITAGSAKLSVVDGDGVSGNPTVDLGTVSTDDLTEGTNQFHTSERAQDAVGSILTDTATIDFTYNDAGDQITADVIPGGISHNSLASVAANEHVDHSTVDITAGVGLTGGGDITASRTLDLSITGLTNVSAENTDEVAVADSSDSANVKKVTVQSLFDSVKAGSFKTNWTQVDGASKAISHSLGTLDVRVEIYDTANGETVNVAEVTRTDVNTVTVNANNLPGTFDFRVLITEVQ